MEGLDGIVGDENLLVQGRPIVVVVLHSKTADPPQARSDIVLTRRRPLARTELRFEARLQFIERTLATASWDARYLELPEAAGDSRFEMKLDVMLETAKELAVNAKVACRDSTRAGSNQGDEPGLFDAPWNLNSR